MHIVILAGGGGTRLWPLSRREKPKQFQKLFGEKTLLEITRMRLEGLVPETHIYYSVTEQTAPFVRDLLPDVSEDHLFIEPEKRDTGPAIGFVVALLALTAPEEPVMFMWSDHYIADQETFQRCLRIAEEQVREHSVMVNIGIVPSWPNPELGYTRVGEQLEERDGIEVLTFREFIEKPSREDAQKMIETGEYLWNAAYFTWTPKRFLAAFKEFQPDMYETLIAIQHAWQKNNHDEVRRLYGSLEKISVDFAIIRKLDPSNFRTIKATFPWSDVGLWSALKKLREENPEDNVVEGTEHLSVDTEDCIIYGQRDKVIATLGIRDLVIVDTPDALLVCEKSKSDQIKKLVELLKEEGYDSVL